MGFKQIFITLVFGEQQSLELKLSQAQWSSVNYNPYYYNNPELKTVEKLDLLTREISMMRSLLFGSIHRMIRCSQLSNRVSNLMQSKLNCTFEYELLTKEKSNYRDHIDNFLRKNFFPIEKVSIKANLAKSDLDEFITRLLDDSIKDGVSTLVWNQQTKTDKKLIAVCLANIEYIKINQKSNLKENCLSSTFKGRFRNVDRLLSLLQSHIDLHHLFQQNTILHVTIVCVDIDFYRKGIGMKAIDRTLKEAKCKGVNAAYAEATSLESCKMFEKFNFQKLKIYRYIDYRDEEGQAVFHSLDGSELNEKLENIIRLPFRFGGLDIAFPHGESKEAYNCLREMCRSLLDGFTGEELARVQDTIATQFRRETSSVSIELSLQLIPDEQIFEGGARFVLATSKINKNTAPLEYLREQDRHNKRASNVLIKGLPESENELMSVKELFDSVGVVLNRDTRLVYRRLIAKRQDSPPWLIVTTNEITINNLLSRAWKLIDNNKFY
ncbi:hypothetical protein GJ496_007943 [Pomphorhynchus laevis]|nr:hypothetical protein GJ496_007943 [Pomphorhynchus laevis]